MLDKVSLEKWNNYAIERLRRYEEEERDPLIQVRDILRQGTPGQYIWELLQNAEDAHATKVLFHLTKESLIFQHNGSVKFSFEHAIAITKVGFSGKIELPSIGQFGVGFKSVFKYAERVEIYEGNLRFALENYTKIINNIQPLHELDSDNQLTTFKVIFKKSLADIAIKDSFEILESFNHESLLFLKNLQEIKIQSEGFKNYIEKQDLGSFRIKILENKNDLSETSFWHLKTQEVTTELKDGNSDTKAMRKTYLGYAIRLEHSENEFKFSQIEKGKIFTYFPLEEQISNLKFHIHAPFVINLNRSMLDSNEVNMNENNRLIKLLSILISSDILQLHSQRKLDESLLTVLPITSDGVPQFLLPIMQGVKQIFQSNKMIKVEGDIYTNPDEVFQATSEILAFIGDTGLDLFNQVSNSKLQRVDPGKNVKGKYLLPQAHEARLTSFLRHIGVAMIDSNKVKEFFEELNYIFSENNQRVNLNQIHKSLNNWLESKNDEAIRKVYALIGRLEIPRVKLKNLPIFITSDSQRNNYRKIEEVFLPTSFDQSEIDVIKGSVYFKGNIERDKLQDLQNFFENLGIREKDEWVVLEHSVARNKHPKSREEEKLRIPYFIHFYNEDKNRFLNIVRGKVFLIGEEFDSDKKFWVEPSSIFLSTVEFNISKLNSLSGESERELTLWDGYDLNSDRENMFRDLGVNFNLRINRVLGTVSFLQTILSSKDLSLLIILWKFLSTLNYSDFLEKMGKVETETNLLRTLKENPWIPMADGSFTTPYECDPADLSKEFQNYSGIFFSISDFGLKIQEESLKSDQANNLAKEAGFDSAEQMSIALKLVRQYSPQELARLIKTEQMNEYSSISNLEGEVNSSKQAERRKPQIEHNEEIVTVRSTYEPAQEERKDQLRKIYGNVTGEISCQMCHLKQMPFKTPMNFDGVQWDYFEAVALFTKHNKESSVNAVALCPNCSAKVKNFRRNHSKGLSDKEVKHEITRLKTEIDQNNSDNSDIYFEFEILEVSYTMKFNKKHLLSLYGLLEVAQEN
jgi:hypothetical protein